MDHSTGFSLSGQSLPLIGTAERRARLGARHWLSGEADSIEQTTDGLVALHATDPATVFLSVSARQATATVDDVEAALFERRTMARTLAMRRTLFVATLDGLGDVELSSSPGVAALERRRLEQFLADSGVDEPASWLHSAFDEVLKSLDHPDGLAARAVTAAVPLLATKLVMGAGTKHEVTANATSRTLGLMAVEGRIVRGRPNGDWTGRQYTWHRRDRWWSTDPSYPADLPTGGGELAVETEEKAAIRLLARWLGRFGPATMADMKWWTGWTMTKTRAALAEIETAEVSLDGALAGTTGFVLAEDVEPVPAGPAWARLLPSLDPTAMGWKDRDWYLGPHKAKLFDRNGNIGPTVWVDGRIVGGWSQTKSGEVVTELLEPVGAEHLALIEADKERVANFVGDVVVRPSFPTPLQKQLSGR